MRQTGSCFLKSRDRIMKQLLILQIILLSTMGHWAFCQRYQLPITVSDGAHTKILRLGMSPGGTDGFDLGLDTLAPPSPPSGAFDARLRVTLPANDFFTDIRTNAISPRTHTMLYVAANGAGPITLVWSQASLDTLDPDGTFVIHDNITGSLFELDMKTAGTLSTSASPFIASSLRIDVTPVHPLPIQLSSFTVTIEGSSIARLSWRTVSELNNYGFEVQKSDTTQQRYQSIPNVFIPGHGTTNEPQHYSYVDSTVIPGTWYYRLKQIDFDGTVHYSDGIRANTLTGVRPMEIPGAFSLLQNYPNPWNPSTTIRYGLPHASFVTLSVYNTVGQQVARLVNEQQQSGYHEATFRGEGLASGVYFYRIQAGDFVASRKLLLLK